MPVEPLDPDDRAHETQSERPDEESSVTEPEDVPIESPEADVLEQRSEIVDDEDAYPEEP